MKQDLPKYLNQTLTALMVLVVFFVPLTFTSFTTDIFDAPKIIFLAAMVLAMLFIWSLKCVTEGKVVITKTPLDFPLLLFLGVMVLSTIFSDSKNTAIFGNLPKIHGSVVSLITYILLYFIITSNLKTRQQVRLLYYALISSSVVVGLVSLASYFGLYLPFQFSQTANFTPAGSSFSISAILALIIPVAFLAIVNPNSFLPINLASALASLIGVALVLIGDIPTGVAALAAVGLSVLTGQYTNLKRSSLYLGIPICLSVLVFALGFIKLDKITNPFYQKRVDFPREIQLPFQTSWKVSAFTFGNTPFLGTGPATYLYNFTLHKPVDFNLTKYWNLRFDTAFNEYLQILGTLGGVGFLAFLYLSIMIFRMAYRSLLNRENNLAMQSIAISSITILVLFALHASTTTVMVVSIVFLAMLTAVYRMTTGKGEDLQLGIKASKLDPYAVQNLIHGDAFPIVALILVTFFDIFIYVNMYRLVTADHHHRLALEFTSKKGIESYKELHEAVKLNPQSDLYRINLAQVDFALANGIAAAKGPKESSPSGSLTDQDKKDIGQLLSEAITEARNATELNPRNSLNYEILGGIYRQITGVAQNAPYFALDSYGRAIQRDPVNPSLRFTVGQIHYSIKSYDLAIRFLSDAMNLKTDFAPAYYNLAITFKDKGDLKNAQVVAETLVSLIKPDDKDYQIAVKLLDDIKSQQAKKNATQNPPPTPSQEEKGPLQKKDLPKVLNLPQPENIATPEAVKSTPKPSGKSSPAPSASPSPSPSVKP